ncbi:B3 domain-containing protein Os01g0234100-like [Neltuma alba]|uniref:B3 domain-containing protein Os01g0234100-like n=1 Tax=Neltuma alba TaxID=207710 RepID=UPI0010A51AB5|nr:B3 domain-containing protein Os01g0234100-like [Prosopis alba]XP_028795648.1 B3 domain-containing protein Os01g0234100-like [Prosopis alba]
MTSFYDTEKKGSNWFDNGKEVIRGKPEKGLRPKRSTIESESLAFERAKEVQANLSIQFPSLIKFMLPSHVSGGFWLGLPKPFCKTHLPKVDTTIVLEDESGREYETKYLADKVGLSGGWRGFSTAHNLRKGDVLVFHLIHPCKFKVYIIRSHGANEVDVALSLLHLDGCVKQHDSNVSQENDPSDSTMICDANMPSLEQPENTSDLDQNLGYEVLNGIRLSGSTITFQQVTSIENFSIVVDGLVLDSELSKHLKTKYYELCCSQGMFLHEHLLEGQNCKLVVGMICETINIADAIRASKITTSSDSFEVWYKSLKALEMFGMNVSFLLARLEQLMSLASKSKRYTETRIKRDQAEEEKKVLEQKIEEVKKTIRRLDGELDSQNQNLERLEAEFQDLAKTPW